MYGRFLGVNILEPGLEYVSQMLLMITKRCEHTRPRIMSLMTSGNHNH
jgi:hypothetical protein